MKWLRKLSIYYKLNGIIISSLLVLSLIIGILMITTTVSLFERQLERRGVETGTSLAALSSNDILLDEHYALFERINKTKNNTEDVRYIIIVDYAGRILAHTFGASLPVGLPIDTWQPPVTNADSDSNSAESTFWITKFDSNEGKIHEVTVPIENGAVGFVRVGMSEQSAEKLLMATIQEFLLLTLLICILASVGATHLAHFIVLPIQNLAKAARQIRSGNYSVHAQIQDEDEVGHLAAAFNDMADSLKAKDNENNRLLRELRAKETIRTTLMNKLLTVQEDERKRISRELHDETGQSLASLLAYMKLLESKLTNDAEKEVLLHARAVAMNVMGELRKMAVDLRPPVLDDLGIIAAMGKYIDNYKLQNDCVIEFHVLDENLFVDDMVALSLYRILQESLTNIAKHAYATDIRIELGRKEEQVKLVISDNGRGVDVNDLADAYKRNRLGVYGMRERAELLGGRFDFTSQPGQGATISVLLPIRLE